MVNDDDTVIASQVDLKMSTVKPVHVHANWAINTQNLIPQRQELFGVASEKWSYYLITDTIYYVLTILHVYGLLHIIPFFI